MPHEVCKSDDPYLLLPEVDIPDPGAIYIFNGVGVSGNQEDGYYYNPGSPDIPRGETAINLDYTSSFGCIDSVKTKVLTKFAPTINFSMSKACLPQDGGIVEFNNTTSGKYSVESWAWDFGDPESGENNFSDLEHPEHFYSKPGFRRVSLTATTFEGCLSDYEADTVIADQPMADFTLINDCFIKGQQTQFLDRSISDFAEIDTLVWTFKTMNGGILGVTGSGSSSDTIGFPFTTIDNYTVSLNIENGVGCQGETTKTIELKPIKSLGGAGYLEEFNGNADGWEVASEGNLESWTLAEPDFTGFEQVAGDRAWFTKLPDHQEAYVEQSWVQSPCFDFSGTSKPVIQMDLMKSFVPGKDGAVLQYQDRVSEGWKTVGKVGEGLEWYNNLSILNAPVGSSFGWGLSIFTPDTEWVKAGHPLDVVAGKPFVKFRIATGTGGKRTIGNQGFAFDNFFIGERIRRSLLEHFTNSASIACKTADDVVDAFAADHSTILINLQYHVDYPGTDPMNLNSPYSPSARSFYYGISGVPYALLNGGVEPDHRYNFSDPDNAPDEDALIAASLETPLFKMGLTVDYQGNRLEGNVITTCLADTFQSNLQLYVVVIEREVTAYTGENQDTRFRNVVLDMLPSPAGKLLGSQWGSGKTDSTSFNWDFAAYVEDIEDLSVVAYVQDRENGNILQAVAIPHTPGVGIHNRTTIPGKLNVYPNPAIDHFFVNFEDEIIQEGQLQIVDLSGRTVLNSELQPGYSIQRLEISDLSTGMYMVYWKEEGIVKGMNRLVIAR